MKRPLLLPTLHLLPAYARLAALLITCVAMVALCAPHTSLSAACPPAEWHAYRTPSHDGLLVLPGSDIDRFCTGGDDGQTLYAIGTWNSPCANGTPEDPYAPDAMLFAPGQAPRLWKSTDGGETWDDRTEKVLTALHLGDAGPGEYDDFLVFTAIASAPDDAGIVLVAGYNTDGKTVMVASNDGAEEFVSIGCNEVDGVILCAAISSSTDGTRDFAVGTTNAIEGGKIWRYEVGTYWTTTWIDTSAYDGWDETKWWNGDPSRVFSVLDVAFSDDYENDRSVLATVIALAEEPDGDPYHGFFMVAGTWNSSVTWNIEAGFAHYPVLVTTPFHTIHAPSTLPALLMRDLADIAVPDGFDADSVSHRTVLVAVN
ncbi:MAG: hypothetical protein JXA58_02895, partial [Dehalococcoidia bacterium]|nr:hypothetical protein [Dehalococcoidia bacterium]